MRRSHLIRGAFAIALALSFIGASEAPAPDSTFLSLPAIDLALPSTGVKVGDRIPLQPAPGSPVSGKLAFEVPQAASGPAESPPIDEQGWAFFGSDTIVPAKPGRLSLPSLAIKNAQGALVARSNPVEFTVESAISPKDPKPEQIAPNAPPVGLPFPRWVIAAAIVLGLAFLAGAIWGVRKWLARSRALLPVIQAPPLPEDQVALDSLRKLAERSHLAKREYKKHYFGVSEILKRYLGARFRFDASESTTFELLAELDERKVVSQEIRRRIEVLFESLDRVKFTDHVPLPGEGEALADEAKKLILQTRRPPVMTGGTHAP